MSESRWTGNSESGGGGSSSVEGVDVLSTGEAAGLVLTSDGANGASWTANGTGDVTGPASSTDNAVARFDLATGKLIQNSSVIISDAGAVGAGLGTLGAPSLSFASRPTLGFYSSGTSTVDLVQGGTQYLVIDANFFGFGGTSLRLPNLSSQLTIGTKNVPTVSSIAIITEDGDVASGEIELENVRNSTASPLILMNKSRGGTALTRTPPLSGDSVGGVLFRPYFNATSASTAARIQAICAENISPTTKGTYLSFASTPTGVSGTIETLRMQGAQVKMMAGTAANIVWNADGAGDIGAAGANRPANLYVSAAVVTGLTRAEGDTSSSILRGGTSVGSGYVETFGLSHGSKPEAIEISNTGGVRLSVDINGKVIVGSTGGSQDHQIRGNGVNLVRPNAGEIFDLFRHENTGVLRLLGGTGTGSGYVATYGATHATKPQEIELANLGGVRLAINQAGKVTVGSSGSTETHQVNSATATAAADVLTMTNGPTGTAGDPDVYLRLNINGTVYAFPGWAV